MDTAKIKQELIKRHGIEKFEQSRRITSLELFNWERNFHVQFSQAFKQYLTEFGLLGFDHSFYTCLSDPEFYEVFLAPDFMDLLLDEGFTAKEIKYLDYHFRTDHFTNPDTVQKIYESLERDKNCFDVGVYVFDDTYNCQELIMLTGDHTDYRVRLTVKTIDDIIFNDYVPIDKFYNGID